MTSPRPRRLGALLLVGGLLTLTAPLTAATVPPPAVAGSRATPLATVEPTEITASVVGRAIAAAAQRRFTATALGAAVVPVGVWTDAQGVLVAPLGTIFQRRVYRGPDGRPGTVLVPLTVAAQRPTVTHRTAPAPAHMSSSLAAGAAPAWEWLAQACFSRSNDVWSWLDHCYQLYAWSAPDGWDYWQLLRYGTAGANWPWALHDAWIGSYATAASAAQQWVQWDPLGDETGPCQVVTVHVTSPAVGISWTVERCDTWHIAKGLAGGSYSLAWSGPGTHGQRGLAYVFAVRVPHGAFAQWALPGGSDGNVF